MATPALPGQEVRELIDDFLARHLGGERADRALATVLRARPGLTSDQRRDAAAWTLGLALWRGRLDLLAAGDRTLWLPLFLVDREHRDPAEVARWCGVDEGLLSAALERGGSLTFADPAERIAFDRSLPLWLARRWIDAWGFPRAEALAAAMNERGPISIRANTLRTDREGLQRRLHDEGIESELSALAPDGLRLRGRPNIHGSPSWQGGLFEVQDEGSQLVVCAAAARPGMFVIDLCAGSGGKTLALAADMRNSGRVVAVDVNAQRLVDLRARMRRGGVSCVEPWQADAAASAALPALVGKADVVLLDAPCSETGALRRGPDARWRLRPEEIDRWSHLQAALLRTAAGLVRPGGRLVYATCSLEREENEVVAHALQAPRLLLTDEARTSPAEQGCDGFYRAIWQASQR